MGYGVEKMSEFVKSLVKDIIIAALLAGCVLVFIRPTIVKQTSMQNTLNPNDYIIMYKRAYSGEKAPKRGDIIIFQSTMQDEEGNDKLLIKRVIGLPGDIISIYDGKVYLNGEEYQESYIKDGKTSGFIKNLEVPQGKYFVMGDNREVSIDSRYREVGFVSKSEIRGKAVLRLFPFSQFGTLS